MRKAPFSFPDFMQKRYFTVENVQPIVDRFGCKDSPESLARQLNDVAGEFDMNKNISTPAVGRKTKAFFGGMARSMEGSKEYIEALGWQRDSFERDATRFGRSIDLQNLAAQLDQLAYTAEYKEKQTPDKPPGRPDNAPLKSLVAELYQIYQEQTGRTFKITYKSATDMPDKYGGEFFSFAKDCLAVMGVKPSNSSLGHIINDVMAKIG